MRITEIDLEIGDIEWYAIDEHDRIARFTSGGSSAVPEYVCESVEELGFVCDFFRDVKTDNPTLAIFADSITKYPDENFRKECKLISSKGLYVFDFSDEMEELDTYILISRPEKSTTISNLPLDIQTRIKKFKIEGADFDKSSTIRVESAYK